MKKKIIELIDRIAVHVPGVMNARAYAAQVKCAYGEGVEWGQAAAYQTSQAYLAKQIGIAEFIWDGPRKVESEVA